MTLTTALPSTLIDSIGADAITTDPEALSQAAVEGVTPSLILRPGCEEDVSATLAWADHAGLAVIPRGSGTTLGYGMPPARGQVVLGLDRLDQILEYEPADLTVTAQAGVTLGRLQQALGERRQWLPIDPARGAGRTLGGLVATAASGPHRQGYGTLRDLLIGLRIVQADGMVYQGGAKVVKNVAGYDIPKLMVGSLGTLGVFTELTFKLQPLPRATATLAVTCDTLETAAGLAGQAVTSTLTPMALTVLDSGAAGHLSGAAPDAASLDGGEAVLLARFGGIPQAVGRQIRELGQMAERRSGVRLTRIIEDDQGVWPTVADLPLDLTEKRAVRLKNAVVPTRLGEALRAGRSVGQAHNLAVGQVAHAGAGVIYTTLRGYGEEDERNERKARAVQALRAAIIAFGGTSVVEHAPLAVKTQVDVWGPTRPDFRLMQAVKAQFDPKGTLNPGRFVGGI